MSGYKETPKIERITWFDHSGNKTGNDFTKREIAKNIKEDIVNRTVGFLVYEDKRRVTLAHEARIDADLEEARFSLYTTIYKVGIITREKFDA